MLIEILGLTTLTLLATTLAVGFLMPKKRAVLLPLHKYLALATLAAALTHATLVFVSEEEHGHGEEPAPTATPATGAEAAPVWSCAMHPQIRQPEPGLCPICNMELVEVEANAGDDRAAPTLELSPRARALAAVETAPVERRPVAVEVRLTGKVQAAESRLAQVAARVPGRIERLFVDFTGMAVRAGDHLVELFSPELLAAQEELLQAMRAGDERTLAAARDRLGEWGLTPAQVAAVEQRGEASERLTIHSPLAGVVLHKHAVEGQYVQTGTNIYTIADLSRVWALLEAYETDLARLAVYQEVELEAEARPGETINGRIIFIDPVLNERTRTAKVRVNVDNPDGFLRPGMFVRGLVRAPLDAGGLAVAPPAPGRFACPMHPEETAEAPGRCAICGMDLEPAAERPATGEAPLVIPATAPLITGDRAVVYVATEPGHYEGREVILGPRAGEYYLVREGLAAGEQVVVNGNFKIDSALQIQARPSMMSREVAPDPAAETAVPETAPAASRPQSLCPIMGGPIDREFFVDYRGQRVYFCCPGCEGLFLQEAERHLREMEAAGIVLERTPDDAVNGNQENGG